MKKPIRVVCRVLLPLSLAVGLVHCQAVPAQVATPLRPVTDEYQGVKVTDNYRWLEDWDSPEVKRWSAEQNRLSRGYLDHLAARPAIKARLKELIGAGSASYYDLQYRGGSLFALKRQPPKQQPLLVMLRSADDPAGEKIVFDPNAASARGSLAVDFFVPSLDGRYVAAAISENGSEDAAAHVFETATGKELADRVPRVNFATAGGSLDWKADGTGFYYTRYPQGNERPPEDANFYQQVYFHRLGTDPRADTYILGKDFPRIAEIGLHTSDDGRWILATVANGDGGEFEHFVMDAAGRWAQITHFADGIVAARIGPDEALYLLSHKDAPRGRILRMPLARMELAQAEVVVPQSPGGGDDSSRASIEGFEPAPRHLYVTDLIGGPSRLRVFDLQGHPLPGPTLPPICAIQQVISTGGGDVLFRMSTYLEPAAWYRLTAAGGEVRRTALYETSPAKFDAVEVVRETALSRDGTHVPLNILRRKGIALDGSHPTLLYGYGGYSISMQPAFAGPQIELWLEQGGVYAVANLRGGAEYGEDWHKAGNLTNKQNVFDDFIACAQHLMERRYTTPARLAIQGGSNGGLLMGAALTQHPELFRAVVSSVGIYDMLRVELDPNGAFNVTEFGTVKDPDQFKALYAYSPYHHVQDGAAYPAVLFTTGENDHRVNPMQSRKMTARLQAATSSRNPILLRTSSTAGHGMGTALDEEIEQRADMFSFLCDQLGVKYVPVVK